MNGDWFNDLAECEFRMSNSNKSLIFPDSYEKHKAEWDAVNVYIECECVNGNDVRIAIDALTDYEMYYKYKKPGDDWNA